MFKEITIRNFKAISDLTIKFTPFTVLIGENSCGKSTILQAIDFLCAIANRDIDEYLKDRGWTYEDIRSQFGTKDDSIFFSASIDVDGTDVVWNITIKYSKKWEITESIINAVTQESYLPASKGKSDLKSSTIKILSSMWAYGNTAITKEQVEFITKIKMFLQTCESYELLSPDRMRRDSRGKVSSIGMGGEKLATYINGMSKDAKHLLDSTISEFIGNNVQVSTSSKGQPGWIEMHVEEHWKNKRIKIKKHYVSDGLLRIIGLCAIMLDQVDGNEKQHPTGVVLLDEIEDGINPDLAEKLIVGFQNTVDKTKRQCIITSHSPVMVNYVNPENIVFMWRDEQGKIHAKPLFEAKKLRDALEFLSPGGAWYHFEKDEIVEALSNVQEEDNG